MSLNRDAVRSYVNKHWFTVCDDGTFQSRLKGTVRVEKVRAELAAKGQLPNSSSWRMVFLPDVTASGTPINGEERACFVRSNASGQSLSVRHVPPELLGKFDIVTFHRDKGLVDCAHYVSRCLTAGGVKINDASVPSLVAKLQNGAAFSKLTKTLGQHVSKEVGDLILNSGVMAFGDLIAYSHGAHHNYTHSALYAGIDLNQHRITCHTLSRKLRFYNETPWNITVEPDFSFTLIHFDAGEDAIPSQVADLFKPVFAVSQGGKTEFIRLLGNGRAEHRSKPPASGAVFGTPDAAGYWFVRGPNVFVMLPLAKKVIKISLTDVVASAIGGAANSITAAVNGLAALARRIGL